MKALEKVVEPGNERAIGTLSDCLKGGLRYVAVQALAKVGHRLHAATPGGRRPGVTGAKGLTVLRTPVGSLAL